jgi:hypothetical protein
VGGAVAELERLRPLGSIDGPAVGRVWGRSNLGRADAADLAAGTQAQDATEARETNLLGFDALWEQLVKVLTSCVLCLAISLLIAMSPITAEGQVPHTLGGWLGSRGSV